MSRREPHIVARISGIDKADRLYSRDITGEPGEPLTVTAADLGIWAPRRWRTRTFTKRHDGRTYELANGADMSVRVVTGRPLSRRQRRRIRRDADRWS
ncbi:MAG: hypothetical protein OXD37_04495 [Acidimicrobiaceae bacterium]|nr:hypothetical protein [Acidimicrobiaceae bacterium]